MLYLILLRITQERYQTIHLQGAIKIQAAVRFTAKRISGFDK